METVQVGFAVIAVLYVLAFATGFWLSVSGRPLNGIIQQIHKLTAVAPIVVLIIIVDQTRQLTGVSIPEGAAIGITVLFFAGAVVTGGLLSTEKPMPGYVKSLHWSLPLLSALGSCATMLLLVMRK